MAAELSRHQRIIVNLAIRILRAAMTRSTTVRVDTIEVQLALRCLLPHCRERWPLEMFWDASSGENAIGRAQGCTAGFNGIVRQLRLTGAHRDEAPLT